jgi:hypothetical protein
MSANGVDPCAELEVERRRRAKRRRQTRRAQALIASAARKPRRYRHRGIDGGPTTSDWLLTASLVESRRDRAAATEDELRIDDA